MIPVASAVHRPLYSHTHVHTYQGASYCEGATSDRVTRTTYIYTRGRARVKSCCSALERVSTFPLPRATRPSYITGIRARRRLQPFPAVRRTINSNKSRVRVVVALRMPTVMTARSVYRGGGGGVGGFTSARARTTCATFDGNDSVECLFVCIYICVFLFFYINRVRV